ncbi:hypothetical protein BT69DRAFT_1287548, partial [Atractiella rhizophila]
VREPRPIYRHSIQPIWGSVLTRIVTALDSLSVPLTSINPLAYADAGEAEPFCPFIISIGVKPNLFEYDDAVTAGAAVQSILEDVGHPTIEVAFVESVVHRSSAGCKLLSFNPLLDKLPELRMPFTDALGLAIAPAKYPHYEGTGALFYRLSSRDDRVALLTCAHVVRPQKAYKNTGMTWKPGSGQPREDVIALGTGAYGNAVTAIMGVIGEQFENIEIWNDALKRLGDPVEGELTTISETREEYRDLIRKAEVTAERANALHDEVTKHRSVPHQRVIGHVLHSEVSVPPHGYTQDWALVEIYRDKIDWKSFKGNKIYIGGNVTPVHFKNTLYPQITDQANYKYPEDGLLQALGVVPEAEFHNPQDLDVHDMKSLLCVKNGRSTRTTFGRVNGLQSIARHYNKYGIHQDSLEVAVLGYNVSGFKHSKFSDAGDSGSIVLGRDGRIIGILTGGAGPSDETDLSYITPYFWLELQIKEKFPGCFLYDIID